MKSKAEELIEELVEAQTVDINHLKSVLKALQANTQTLIRVGGRYSKDVKNQMYAGHLVKWDTMTAHLAEAISDLDEWIEAYEAKDSR